MSIWNIASWFKRSFWLSETGSYIGSSDVYSGKPVTIDTALGLSAFWACVRLISESIASLPLGVYEMDAKGNKIPARESELYKILHDAPNADMTAIEYIQSLVASLLIWGNSYSLKTYRGRGADRKLVSIEPLRPDLMTIRANENGSFTYIYSDTLGHKEYSEDEIMHVKAFGLSGRVGLSVIAFARNSLGNSMALEESSGRLYSNGLRPGGALTMPGVLKDTQRAQIRQSIADQVGGVSRSGGLIVLEGDMKYQPLSMPPEDAQMIESRGFGIEEVCRWFGVPPMLVGHTEKTTTWGTGLEQINLGFLTYTLQPYIKRIEQAVKRNLIAPADRDRLFAEFNIEGFLRADSSGRAALYSSAAQNGWMTRAEIRKKENLPEIEGSDQLTVQSALVPLDILGQMQQNSTVEDSAKV